MSDTLIPCSCPFCKGNLVTKYIRGQHSIKYNQRIAAKQDEVSDNELEQSTGAVQTPDADETACDDDVNRYESCHDYDGDGFYNEQQVEDGDEFFNEQQVEDGDGFYNEQQVEDAYGDGFYNEQQIKQVGYENNNTSSSTPVLECELSSHDSNLHFDPDLYNRPEATTPLYEGASITILEAVSQHLDWFTAHPGTSKESLSDILRLQHLSILPSGNLLPQNYAAAMKIVEPFLIQPITFDVCINDCIIYRNEYSTSLICPKCKAPRYKYATFPAKKFTYLPIRPRLERLFGTASISQLIQGHSNPSRTTQEMYDIQDSPVWKDAYASNGIFKGDRRGVSLSLCTDGVNPFSHQRVTYSMWPIMVTILNMPRKFRNSSGSILLLGIIPGSGKKEPALLSPYLEIVVDELLQLANSSTYDAYAGAPYEVKVQLLLYVLDYPGVCKVFNVSGSGAYKGCMWCDIKGTYISDLKKMVYPQYHKFVTLDPDESPKSKRKKQTKPKAITPSHALRGFKEAKSFHQAYDHTKSKKSSDAIAKSTGCKGCYSLMRLPDHDPMTQCVPDAMHTVKDVLEKLFGLLTGKENTQKVQQCEKNLGRFCVPSTTKKRSRSTSNETPRITASYSLTKDELLVADQRALKIITPAYIDFKPTAMFAKPSYHKSHDWKQIGSQGILKYCLRGSLGATQRQTLFRFIDFIASLTKESFKQEELEGLKEELRICSTLMEKHFPLTLQVITFHLLNHVVEGISKLGPVYGTWMYSFERFNSWMCQRVLNRANPETTVIQTYRIFEWCGYMRMSGRLPTEKKLDRIPSISRQGVISTIEVTQIDVVYRGKIELYSRLITEYECEKRKAKAGRCLNTFPVKEAWTPHARSLSDTEHDLMKGPSNQVVFFKKLSIRNECTGRLIEYSASDSENDAVRIASSYVAVVGDDTQVPTFARIKSLFAHSFSSAEFDWAIVKVFKSATLDTESKMWSVPLNAFANVQCTLLTSLSDPLVVAVEESTNKLWFLNFLL